MAFPTLQLLDCTLRDGGYYTNWDFETGLVDRYVKAMEALPLDYIELGYRCKPLEGYYGEYFYMPKSRLEALKAKCPNTGIALMLDEKNNSAIDAQKLFGDLKGLCDMVRITVAPGKTTSALKLAATVKEMGYKVALNFMYLSQLKIDASFFTELNAEPELVDFLYLVDSFGGMTPDGVRDQFTKAKEHTDLTLGFHGHNNLEMALINSIYAVDAGANIVDGTILGMGRGAGNLKTELFLTYLQSQNKIKLDFSDLSYLLPFFEELQQKYGWGTNLPYMVSGAHSLPQKDVMNWMGKKRYSVSAIVQALTNQSENIKDNKSLPYFNTKSWESVRSEFKNVIVIGGGRTVDDHLEHILLVLKQNRDILVIHSSARHLIKFLTVPNVQLVCLTGNEGSKLDDIINREEFSNIKGFLFPPFPRTMGTYIPESIFERSFQLNEISFIDTYHDAPLTLALQLTIEFKIMDKVMLVGFDGYYNTLDINNELKEETQWIIDAFQNANGCKLSAYTATNYRNLTLKSIYTL